MPKITWQVEVDVVDITNKILSMNITQGREKYLDNYSGGSCTFTIDNANNVASTFSYGSEVYVTGETPGTGSNNGFLCVYWIQEIVFNDHPGNTGLNTATITAVDWVARAGRVQANSLSLPQNNTGFQLNLFEQGNGGPLPADMTTSSFGGSSTAAAITYTGTVNNYLNLLQATERGYVVLRGANLFWIPRSLISSLTPENATLGRTTSTTQIAYQQFTRIQNGTQFINTATVDPDGLASQTSTNATSVAAYGPAFYSSFTVDYDTTQASGNADWIANNFSDPASLRFTCSVVDVAQDSDALDLWVDEQWGGYNRTINLSYQVPGGSLTTIPVVMEGASINVTPESTTFDMTFSPLQYYQFFTLDSSTLGILDTSRLGW
jgi:hypothetical protein